MTPTLEEKDNIIHRSIKWADGKGLLQQGINPEIDIGFIFEECLEMLRHDKDKCNQEGLKLAHDLSKIDKKNIDFTDEEVAELLDGCGDLIIYTINFMGKMLKDRGYSESAIPNRIENILDIIMHYNELKNLKMDNNGKLIKNEEFEKRFKQFYPQDLITKLLSQGKACDKGPLSESH